jgi:hypothetical protein
MKTILFIFFIVCTIAIANSQYLQVDSLQHLLIKQNTDTGKIHLLMAIATTYSLENNDIRLKYFQQAADLAHETGHAKK